MFTTLHILTSLSYLLSCSSQDVLSPQEFYLGIQDGLFDAIIDVRTATEWEEDGHIENATFVESLASTGNAQKLNGCETCTIAVYCRSGVRSAKAIERLQNEYGFTGDLYNCGGIMQWTTAGYPLVNTNSAVAACSEPGNSCTTSDTEDVPDSTSCTCNDQPLVPDQICGDGRLETLCTAVKSIPGLVETLSREDLMYTVFAPNDQGWGNLMLIHDNLLEDEDKLTNLLLNHVVVGFNPICAEDLRCGNLLYMANGSQKGQRTKTACSYTEGPPQGDDETGEPGEEPTKVYQKGDGNGSSKGNMPEIVAPDTCAKNGVIHIIDNVILQKDSFGPPEGGGDDDQ